MDVSTIKGVVFDLDGTLVDSGLDFAAMRRDLGFPEEEPILEHLATLQDPQQVAGAKATIERHEMAGAEAASWMPGAQGLLELLAQRDIPTAILTRNMRAATQTTINSLQIPIELVITREDCKPKPDPEGLLRIAEQWQLASTAMVYIGDYIFDLDAANNAGMVACLYRNQHNTAFIAHADWVIDHFDDLTDAFREGGK